MRPLLRTSRSMVRANSRTDCGELCVSGVLHFGTGYCKVGLTVARGRPSRKGVSVTSKRSPRAPHVAPSRVPIVSIFRLISEHFVSAIPSSRQPLLIDPFCHHPAILAGRQSDSDASCTYPQGFTLAHTSLPCSPFACFCPRCLVFLCSTFRSLYYTTLGRNLSAISHLMSLRSPCLCPVSRSSPHYLTSFPFTYLPCLPQSHRMLTDSFVFLGWSLILYSVRNCIYTVARSNETASPRRSPLHISVCLNLIESSRNPFIFSPSASSRLRSRSVAFCSGTPSSLKLAWLFITKINFVLLPPIIIAPDLPRYSRARNANSLHYWGTELGQRLRGRGLKSNANAVGGVKLVTSMITCQ